MCNCPLSDSWWLLPPKAWLVWHWKGWEPFLKHVQIYCGIEVCWRLISVAVWIKVQLIHYSEVSIDQRQQSGLHRSGWNLPNLPQTRGNAQFSELNYRTRWSGSSSKKIVLLENVLEPQQTCNQRTCALSANRRPHPSLLEASLPCSASSWTCWLWISLTASRSSLNMWMSTRYLSEASRATTGLSRRLPAMSSSCKRGRGRWGNVTDPTFPSLH